MTTQPPTQTPLAGLTDRIELSEREILHRLLEAAPDAMLVADGSGVILYANGQLVSMFGYTAVELIGHRVEMLIPERLRARHAQHRSGYMQAPAVRPMGLDMTLTARRADGSEFPVEISLSPVALDGTRVVTAGIRDVSRLQSAREAVARGRYNAFVAQIGQQVIGLRDVDAMARAITPLVAQALETDVALLYLLDAGGTKLVCHGAHGVPDDLLAQLGQPNEANSAPGHLLKFGTAVVVEDYAQETRFRPDAASVALGLVSALGVPIVSESGPIGALAVRTRTRRSFSEDDRNFLQSVGNVVAAAIKWLRAEEQLRHSQRLEAVGQLTGGIAHDFNNLLTVIMGNLQMVEDDVAGDEAIAGPVEAALRAATSAAELTRKLLAISRRQALRPQPIDVNELVGGMLNMIRRTLGERITILAYPQTQLPDAYADPGQLETALLNLVVNARDAMPEGGRLAIETAVRTLEDEYAQTNADVKSGPYVMIAVSDNGTGMARDVLKRAFDPYFTTKERGKGSGLGLSMAHGFAKQSGGHIAIYSEPGRGTTVRLYLPFAQQPDATPSSADATEVPGGNEVVLMVEDEPDVRALGARLLAGLGYQVYPTGDAASALALLEQRSDFSLLFTDIVLPGAAGGVELAREAIRRRPDLRVLFTSGYASAALADVERLKAPLLDKPYRRETLARAVRAALDAKRNR